MKTLILIIFLISLSLQIKSDVIIWEDFFPIKRNVSENNNFHIIKTSNCDFVSLFSQFGTLRNNYIFRVNISKISNSGVLIWRRTYDLINNVTECYFDDTLCSSLNKKIYSLPLNCQLALFESDHQTIVLAVQYSKSFENRLNQTELDFDGNIIKRADVKLLANHRLSMHIWKNNLLLLSHHSPTQIWYYSMDSMISNINFNISLLDTFNCNNSVSYYLQPLDTNFFILKKITDRNKFNSYISKGYLDLNGTYKEIAHFDIWNRIYLSSCVDMSSRLVVIGKIGNQINLLKYDLFSYENIPLQISSDDYIINHTYYSAENIDFLISGYRGETSNNHGLSLYKFDSNGTKISSVEWLNYFNEPTNINGLIKSCDDSCFVVIAYLPEPYNCFYTAKVKMQKGDYVQNTLQENDGQIYPNPFIDELTLEYSLYNTSKINIEIYDLLSRKVFALPEFQVFPGKYSIKLDLQNLTNGYYSLLLKVNDDLSSFKLFKLN